MAYHKVAQGADKLDLRVTASRFVYNARAPPKRAVCRRTHPFRVSSWVPSVLFNSYTFIFLFLPVTLAGYLLIARWRSGAPLIGWLLAASLVFYGWWNPPYLLLMAGSISFNYAVGVGISHLERAEATKRRAAMLVVLAIAANLALLGYYKYANFFVDSLDHLSGLSLDLPKVVLPLAISFHTIQQIA